MVHIAALIAEFLNLAEPSPGLPVGCAAFEHVSHSALEEVLESSGDLLGGVTDDEATTELQIFTEDGLVKVMCQAIEYLKQAELYEACNELYKLVLPIFEKNRDYLKLSAAHLDLKEIFDKIILSVRATASLSLFVCSPLTPVLFLDAERKSILGQLLSRCLFW